MKPFLSILFHLITSIRNFFYDHKILSSTSIKVPVISVGNIEMGGTGKTPVVLYLSKLLLNSNYKPVLLVVDTKEVLLVNKLFAMEKKFFLMLLSLVMSLFY